MLIGNSPNLHHYQATLHAAQLLYFSIVAAAPLLAADIWPAIHCRINTLALPAVTARKAVCWVIGAVVVTLVVREFTVEHPFLLADNRHYTFYVWKNFFRKHWVARYLPVPAYALALYRLGVEACERKQASGGGEGGECVSVCVGECGSVRERVQERESL